ncbi:GNAT family N-acetyltransferase [Streptomyces sp. RKND-216]|uniref:GNAT family N-acetyltransferase n=1 Tax=Streptomyces sp. RKND-216 TaxID=2562581 RepID=UPI00109DFD6A|nr:GNAT family N-acetyltransferase [Streptomyces sp. RKND-216]THA25788.1 GNAT family N-acetyltransferase [Streptomyces sp. RKND-216]
MDVTVHAPGELSAADRAAWAGLQARAWESGNDALANPFLSYGFTAAVGDCFGGVQVAVVRDRREGPGVADGGTAAAFFPFRRSPLGVGTAVGLGVSDCQGMVHDGDFRADPHELLRACGLAIWEFDHLAEMQWPFGAAATRWYPSPVIDVGDGYEPYLEGLRSRSPKLVRDLRRRERKLERELGELRYVHDERDPDLLRTLMRWKSAQYRRTGRSDRFAQPELLGLVEQLFGAHEPECAGLLSVLYAGERPIAGHFGLRSQQVISCWFPAYDTDHSNLSPGMLLHLKMAEHAAASGQAYLDLGRGEMWYKDALKTRELRVGEGWVKRPHPVAFAHQVRRGPLRALRRTVLGRPGLRRPADRLLRRLGRLRSGSEA